MQSGWRLVTMDEEKETPTNDSTLSEGKLLDYPLDYLKYRAECLLFENKFEQALFFVEYVTELDPEDLLLQDHKAYLYNETGKPRKAIALWSLLNEKRGPHARTHYNIGCAYYDLGQMLQAIDCWRASLEMREASDTHMNLAKAYEKLGDKQKSIYHLKEYKKLRQNEEE